MSSLNFFTNDHHQIITHELTSLFGLNKSGPSFLISVLLGSVGPTEPYSVPPNSLRALSKDPLSFKVSHSFKQTNF